MSLTPLAPSSSPLISVVIPTHNYGHFLLRALRSVQRQLDDDVELLVIDDGSTDNTSAVVSAFQHDCGVVAQLITQPNRGAAAARNHGIRAACGRYVLLLDADDELMPDALQTFRDALLAAPEAGMVLGAYWSVSTDGIRRFRPATAVLGNPAKRIRRYLLEKKIAVSCSRTLLRRDLLLQRPFPEQLRSGEDVAVFAYVMATSQVVTTTTAVTQIYKHADSLRHRPFDEACAQQMVAHVFAALPSECQRYRSRYEAQRYLSLYRDAWQQGDFLGAANFYRQALYLRPLHTLCQYLLSRLVRPSVEPR